MVIIGRFMAQKKTNYCYCVNVPDNRLVLLTDLFEKIMPLAVHQALMGFENNKATVVNTEVGRLREATELMNRWVKQTPLPLRLCKICRRI